MAEDKLLPMVDYALGYARRGWRVIPLHSVTEGRCSCSKGTSCPSAGKHPRIKAWQKSATTDEEVIVGWWQRWPDANIGVVFGKDSNLVDFECDTPEEERALLALFAGDMPVTLCFRSSRGKHWLFLWRGDLPDTAVLKVAGVGIRIGGGAKGAMSVFPPSLHPSGERYTWIVSPEDGELAAIPDEVHARICNWESGPADTGPEAKPQEHWERIAKGVAAGSRNEDMASYIGRSLRDVNSPNDPETAARIFLSVEAINARNRPPLDEAELRRTFDSILTREIQRRNGQAKATPELAEEDGEAEADWSTKTLYIEAGLELRNGQWWPGQWRAGKIPSDPRKIRLYAPILSDDGVLMTTDDFDSATKVHRIVLGATGLCLFDRPKVWPAIWGGIVDAEGRAHPGLKSKLLRAAEWESIPSELKRDAVLSSTLLEVLVRARVREPDASGQPSMTTEGDVLFKVARALEEINLGRPRSSEIGWNEFVEFLATLNVQNRRERIGERRHKFKVLTKQQIESLEERANTD